MANKNGNAYGLTLLCPIKNGHCDGESYSTLTRWFLQQLPLNESSPMAKVPNTYLCRFYVLNDVFYQGGREIRNEHLQSRYLVFSSNFYGELDNYLNGMWQNSEKSIREIWRHCIAFDQVNDVASFIAYIKKCQIKNDLFFVGSNDEPLAEQLKALYLKQEFSRFVYQTQKYNNPESAEKLQQAFGEFIKRTRPTDLSEPTWLAGAKNETVI